MAIFDVASYILKKQGIMTAMKLQKLFHYSQCWSLVWRQHQTRGGGDAGVAT